MTPTDTPESSGNESKPYKRRPRYAGTHPKRYEDKYKEHDIESHPDMAAHLRAKGITPAGSHVSVLVEEALACLRPGPGEIVVDGTLGHGGHARRFLEALGPSGRLIGLDVDGVQLERTGRRLTAEYPNVSLHRGNFAGIAGVLGKEGLSACDIIFVDLGISSMQIDDPQRGMSYKHDGPLDMRMDDRLKRTAADLLAALTEREIAEALRDLADEPDHAAIARRIVAERAIRPITRTVQLVDLVFEVRGLTRQVWRHQQRSSKSPPPHPAARTFQTLRMLVNDELGCLRELLRIAPYCLRPGGRIGVISFHSGEDRLVKQSFREGLHTGVYESAAEDPITPTHEERRQNPRSAPAKLRWAAKPQTSDHRPCARGRRTSTGRQSLTDTRWLAALVHHAAVDGVDTSSDTCGDYQRMYRRLGCNDAADGVE